MQLRSFRGAAARTIAGKGYFDLVPNHYERDKANQARRTFVPKVPVSGRIGANLGAGGQVVGESSEKPV